MNTAMQWIRTRPIISFLLLTLVFTYVLLFPAVLFLDRATQTVAGYILFYAGRLGVYVPVLVGIAIVRLSKPDRDATSISRWWASFVVVWAVSTVVCALDLRRAMGGEDQGLVPYLIVSTPLGTLPGLVVASALGRVPSLRAHLRSLVHPPGHVGWYLAALLTFPVAHLLGSVVTQLLAGKPPLSEVHFERVRLFDVLLTFAFVFFFSGGINEEGGWRAFAQKRLQARLSPLLASLILWAYLVLFHIPNDLIQYSDGGYLRYRILLYPFTMLLYAWLFNRTGGSLLAIALFHASMNSMNVLGSAMPATDASTVLLVALSLVALVADRMWKRLPIEHPAVYSPQAQRRE